MNLTELTPAQMSDLYGPAPVESTMNSGAVV